MKSAVVIGLGLSGMAAVRLLVARGYRVLATDRRDLGLPALENVTFRYGDPGELDADLIVVSPGVPRFPALARAEEKGTPIWGEVELAVRFAKPAPVVAIGGTNGKSTTTTLVGAFLEAAGKKTFTGGNLGEPLAAHADEPFDVLVLEVSSFQMERVDAFHPKACALLNVSPDHLDRYDSEEAYANAKGNSFLRQTPDDIAVIPVNDRVCLAQAKRGHGRIVTFGPGGDVDVTRDSIIDGGERYERSAIALQGGHNALNVAAALACVRPFAIAPKILREVLASFAGLAHRMVFVREREGVRYYDDSKGTNVGAVVTALEGTREEKVVLIAGGKDKGGSYGPLVDVLVERGRAAVLIGEAAPLIRDAIGDKLPVRLAASMEDAVKIASELAKSGDAVLLSPACSSFDMFKDYKERGDVFVKAVNAL